MKRYMLQQLMPVLAKAMVDAANEHAPEPVQYVAHKLLEVRCRCCSLPSAVCLLRFAFCSLPSAACFMLLTFCSLPSAVQGSFSDSRSMLLLCSSGWLAALSLVTLHDLNSGSLKSEMSQDCCVHELQAYQVACVPCKREIRLDN